MTLESICQRLRERREELGIDLETAVEQTKLHPSVIQAIESGQIEKIALTYRKGFMKIYAAYLGVPIEDLFREVTVEKEQGGVQGRRKTHAVEPFSVVREKIREFIVLVSVRWPRSVAVGVLLVLVLVIVRFVPRRHEASQDRVSVQPEVSSQPSAVGADVNSKDVKVSVRVKKDCFVRVILDGKVLYEGVLKKGVLESWHAQREIELKIGDGSSLDIEVNGRLLPPLTKIRQPIKSLKISADGISIVK